MKNLFKMGLPVIALTMGISSALAFRSDSEIEKSQRAGAWYKLTQQDQTQASSYEGVASPELCGGSESLCAIFLATDNGIGQHPEQNEVNQIQSHINTVVNMHDTDDATVKLKTE